MRLKQLLAVPLVAASATASTAAPSGEEYELQERCGKRAFEVFQRDWGAEGVKNTKDGQATVGYRNQYSARFNRCFILITYRDIPIRAKQPRVSVQMNLFEVNTNKTYGTYFRYADELSPVACEVNGRTCQSLDEWNTLIAPYVGE